MSGVGCHDCMRTWTAGYIEWEGPVVGWEEGRRELYTLHGNVKLMENCVKLRRGESGGESEGMVGRGGGVCKECKGQEEGSEDGG